MFLFGFCLLNRNFAAKIMTMMGAEKTSTTSRIEQIDYLKAVMIILMVAFHLVYIGDYYTYAKQIVYTFHMPAFLVISGYLMKTERPIGRFMRTIWWILVPYVVMETAYTLMAARLPIREHIDVLTAGVVLEKVLLHPLGPYWYLHTMIVCGITTFAVGRFVKRNTVSRLIITGLLLFAISRYAGLLSTANAMYFLAGAAIRLCECKFLQIVRPSKWAILGLILLCSMPECLDRAATGGVFIVYLSMSFLLYLWRFIFGKLKSGLLFVGRNTLLVVLFSPIFTILCKQLIPLLQFDSSRLLFLFISVFITICGSMAIGWILDKLNISRYLLGKDKAVISVHS